MIMYVITMLMTDRIKAIKATTAMRMAGLYSLCERRYNTIQPVTTARKVKSNQPPVGTKP